MALPQERVKRGVLSWLRSATSPLDAKKILHTGPLNITFSQAFIATYCPVFLSLARLFQYFLFVVFINLMDSYLTFLFFVCEGS